MEPLRINFYFINIGLWALILRDIAFASYFGKSFFLPLLFNYKNRHVLAGDTAIQDILMFSTYLVVVLNLSCSPWGYVMANRK